MAKISLRVYNREIESMIEGGQLDEAIAHCHHILKTFPMHLETYRLLGKAHLEARRFADAADIFLRILQAVPDDFVSHVGMSIIRDEENKLDEAIWHMERAFEMQPSNAAIQGELRRLYGRRDGVEPPKIRLSRDALANMYIQGELFNQAIAEIRSVLAEDPDRADLQVMLARAHFRAGQKVEAAEIAIQLLKKYPNCLDALRILLDVLPGTTRAEDTEVYRPRLVALDPYAAFVTGSVFQSDQVADAAVGLERMDYRPVAGAAPAKSDWAASLGVKMESKKEGKPPAWLASAEQPAAAFASAPPPDRLPVTPAPAGDDAIPPWLREAGWQESTGEAKEGPLDLSPEPPVAEPLAQAEIPDWLKSMAPPDAAPEPSALAPEAPGSSGEDIDWLKSITPPQAASEPAAPPPAEAGELPDWLRGIQAETAAPAPAADVSPAAPQETAPAGPTGAAKPLGIDDDSLAWLESLAAKQGAKPEELLTRPEDRPAEAPPSVAKLAEEMPAAAPEEAAPAPTAPTGSAQPLGIEDDTLAWLESLAAKQGAKPEELLTRPEGRPAEAPPSVAKLAEEKPAAPPEEAIPAPSTDDTVSAWLKNLDEAKLPSETPPPAATPAGQPELPDWLKDLERPAPAAVPPAAEEMPEWLPPAAESAPAPVEPPPSPAEGLPEWLQAPAAPLPDEEVPIWARDEGAPLAAPPPPAAAGEWIPAAAVEPPETPPAAPAPAPAAAPIPASRPTPTKPTGMLSRIPEKEKDADILSAAQAALNGGKLNEAMAAYARLIKKARLLDEVIHDLREAIYRFPVDIIVWQTLGDAYMRANRLQDALDAYTKAEELLR